MKEFLGKTVEEALEAASIELGIEVDDILYEVADKKKGLFSKKILVEVYEMNDIIRYAEDYILNVLDNIGIESTVNTKLNNDIMYITIDSTHNPVLIGKNGVTLQALNELTRLAVSSKFHRHFRILLDVNGYKNNKYSRIERTARKIARDVAKTKATYTFAPMPSDERRAIHNACNGMPHIRTESIGEGNKRQVTVIYVE